VKGVSVKQSISAFVEMNQILKLPSLKNVLHNGALAVKQ
jgi:hypothetical protein